MKYLLLEDDIELNETICQILQLENCDVSSFFDGSDALYHIEKNRYDVYIMDINVPNINGLELLECIKKTYKNSKVIMISSNIDIKTIEKSYNLGCYDFLKKPFYIEELRLKLLNIKKEYFSSLRLSRNLYYDINNKQLLRDDIHIELTKKESLLLCLLVRNYNKLVSKDEIIEFVFENKYTNDVNIRAIITRVRKKLDDNIISTVAGVGYCLRVVENITKISR
ncbi:MAG: response regulator transcription factor [Campylobacterota bacterium]|nr:response regulator transcription factor [Campylobacterota bacterium]